MKLITLMTILSSTLLLANVPETRMVPVDNIFVPKGFDNNDNVEIVVTGMLPNLCHKSPKAEIKVVGDEIKVSVTSLYYHHTNPFCPEMVVPFKKVVELGVLPKGNFKIVVNDKTQWKKENKINILKAVDKTVDHYQYAYVDEIQENIEKDILTLRGYNPSDCYEIDKISYISNGLDTYSVLPRMKKVRDFCPMKMMPFSISWELPHELKSKKVLLHVRTLNGNSINKVIQNFEDL